MNYRIIRFPCRSEALTATTQRSAASAATTVARDRRPYWCALFLLVCFGIVGCASPSDQQVVASLAEDGGSSPGPGKQAHSDAPAVLFLCPHNASKSVIAATQFQRLAEKRGLRVRATSAGTDPSEVDRRVIELLHAYGIRVEHYRPRRVTQEEVEAAHLVVSLGCDVSELASPHVPILRWDDVPPPSKDLEAAHDDILIRVERLVNQLSECEAASAD